MSDSPIEHDRDDIGELGDQELDAALDEPAEDLRAGLSVLLSPPEGLADRATAELKERLLERRTLDSAIDLLALGLRTGRLLLSANPRPEEQDDA